MNLKREYPVFFFICAAGSAFVCFLFPLNEVRAEDPKGTPPLSSIDRAFGNSADFIRKKIELNRLNEQGNRAIAEERWADAEDAFLEAIRVDPDFPPLYQGLGLVYAQTKDYASAEIYLKEAARRFPNEYRSQYGLAKVCVRLGDLERAEKYYLKAVEIDPSEPATYHDLAGIYYQRQDWPKTLRYLEKAVEINPNSVHTLTLMGVTAVRAERIDIALEMITRLKEAGELERARKLELMSMRTKWEKQEAARPKNP